MLTEPISITGRLTYEDLLEIHRFRVSSVVRPSILVLLGFVSLLILTLIIGASMVSGFKPSTYGLIAIFVYWPWGWLLTRRFAGRGRLRRAAAASAENTATFTADSVSVANEDAAARFAWRRLAEIVETRGGMLFILPRKLVWFYLPWRVLHEKDRADILATAAAHKVRVTTRK